MPRNPASNMYSEYELRINKEWFPWFYSKSDFSVMQSINV